jgi:hypothetical protein
MSCGAELIIPLISVLIPHEITFLQLHSFFSLCITKLMKIFEAEIWNEQE